MYNVYNEYINGLKNALTNATTFVTKNKSKEIQCPWFNSELEGLCRYKQTLMKQIRQTVLSNYLKKT